VKLAKFISAVNKSTTMTISEMSLTFNMFNALNYVTRDKQCQSNCSKWPDLLVHDTSIEFFLPLINYCFVCYTQLEASQGAHQPLPQISHVLYWRVVNLLFPASLPKCSNQPVLINARAVGRPHVRSNEFGFLTRKQLQYLTCTMSQCTVLLKDVNVIDDA